MLMRLLLTLVSLATVTVLPDAASGDIVLQTQNLRLVISDNGVVQSLQGPGAIEYLAQPKPLAAVVRGGRPVFTTTERNFFVRRQVWQGGDWFSASRAVLAGDTLTVEFGKAGVTAIYEVIRKPEYLAFELRKVRGEPVDRIDLLQLTIRRPAYLGEWINVAFDDDFGICLCGGNVKTDAAMHVAEQQVTLRATAEKRVSLEGTTAVLFGCRDPQHRFLDVMETVERDFDMPAGARHRRLPAQKRSYLWASRPTPENIDEYIRWAKRGGLRMILFSYKAFSSGAGHFLWKPSYPAGMADLKRVTDAIRAAGLTVGLHIHYCKAYRKDPYVTPVPDDRLHKVRSFTLVSPVDSKATTIPVAENPQGCTLDKDRRILQIGKELISYDSYTTSPPFRFTGCQRGHLSTKATQHLAGASAGLLNVDSWVAFIRFDQNTDIQDEVARRLGEIVRHTGPYEMVYFDGAEDVHDPYWYHVANSQLRVFHELAPRPLVCESAHYTHFSWHMMTRSNAYDKVAPAEGMKAFCDLMPCPTAAARARDFSRIDFGWLGHFELRKQGYAGPDVWEYVLSRAAAWDCPISLGASVEEIRSNPRAECCLDVIKTWEDARLAGKLTEADRQRLQNVSLRDGWYVPCYDQRGIWSAYSKNERLLPRQQDVLAARREHHLFINEQGKYELVEYHEIPSAAGGIKAYWFQRSTQPRDTYLLVWAVQGEQELLLSLPPAHISAMRPFGHPVVIKETDGKAMLPVGRRTHLRLQNTTPNEAIYILRAAQEG